VRTNAQILMTHGMQTHANRLREKRFILGFIPNLNKAPLKRGFLKALKIFFFTNIWQVHLDVAQMWKISADLDEIKKPRNIVSTDS
jgi:hypothetical protein